MKLRVWMIAIIALMLAVTLAACGGNDQQPQNDANPPAQEGQEQGQEQGQAQEEPAAEADHSQAQAIFQNQCVACHGADLSGTMANTNLQQVGARLSQDEIAQVITNGRNIMPSFKGKLADEEINALAAWLATKK